MTCHVLECFNSVIEIEPFLSCLSCPVLRFPQVVSSVSDHTIRVWSAQTGQETQRLMGHQAPVHILECHPLHHHLLMSASYDGTIRLWNLHTGKMLRRYLPSAFLISLFLADFKREPRLSKPVQVLILEQHLAALSPSWSLNTPLHHSLGNSPSKPYLISRLQLGQHVGLACAWPATAGTALLGNALVVHYADEPASIAASPAKPRDLIFMATGRSTFS